MTLVAEGLKALSIALFCATCLFAPASASAATVTLSFNARSGLPVFDISYHLIHAPLRHAPQHTNARMAKTHRSLNFTSQEAARRKDLSIAVFIPPAPPRPSTRVFNKALKWAAFKPIALPALARLTNRKTFSVLLPVFFDAPIDHTNPNSGDTQTTGSFGQEQTPSAVPLPAGMALLCSSWMFALFFRHRRA